MRDVLEIGLVLRVGLDAEGGGEDELADGCAEAGEESIEGLDPLADALNNSHLHVCFQYTIRKISASGLPTHAMVIGNGK